MPNFFFLKVRNFINQINKNIIDNIQQTPQKYDYQPHNTHA